MATTTRSTGGRNTGTRKTAARAGTRRSTTSAPPKAARGAKARANAAPRDSHGRFKPDHHVRNAAFGATAALGAVAAGVAAAFKFGLLDRFLPRGEGHDAEDLLIDSGDAADAGNRPTARAPAAFRPDMDAPMSAAEKEALRPPKGTRARADEGSIVPA